MSFLTLPLVFAVVAGELPATAASSIEDDVDLALAAQAGDRVAVTELIRRHQPRLLRMVRAMVPHPADAEDIVQDTFVSALAALPRYKPQGSVAGWLAVIALNTARKRLRGVRRVTPTDPHDLTRAQDSAADQRSQTPHDALHRGQLAAALRAALSELGDRERAIIQLRYGAELPSAEVAQALGLSDANVRKIAERARQALERRLHELTDSPARRSQA